MKPLPPETNARNYNLRKRGAVQPNVLALFHSGAPTAQDVAKPDPTPRPFSAYICTLQTEGMVPGPISSVPRPVCGAGPDEVHGRGRNRRGCVHYPHAVLLRWTDCDDATAMATD